MKTVSVVILVALVILMMTFWLVTLNQLDIAKQERQDINKIKLESGLKDVKIRELQQQQTTTTESVKPIDQHTLEYVVSYNESLQIYVMTLRGIMDNNKIIYPEFIYQKLVEGE